MRAEADGIFAIALRRNVGPCALLVDERPDPVCIVAAVSEHHCLRPQAGQQSRTQPIVVRFTGRYSEPHWQSIGVNNHVKLARQSAPRAANRLARAVSNASGMLVDAHHRGVDHLHRGIMCGCQRVHDACPDACPPPTNEPIVAGGTRAIDVWKIAPGRARSQYPEDAIENAPIIHTGHAARLVREHHSNGAPFVVGKLITHDCRLRMRSRQHLMLRVPLFGPKRSCGKVEDTSAVDPRRSSRPRASAGSNPRPGFVPTSRDINPSAKCYAIATKLLSADPSPIGSFDDGEPRQAIFARHVLRRETQRAAARAQSMQTRHQWHPANRRSYARISFQDSIRR